MGTVDETHEATTEVTIRVAEEHDVRGVVELLADDELGAQRESPADLHPYYRAFAEMKRDPNQLLVVADRAGELVGTLQLTVMAGLARRGAKRAQLEGVRVRERERGTGLGSRLIRWAVAEARARECVLVQFTSDRTREQAHRFYENLGFEARHLGFKLDLTESSA